jgi:hypothetical protein
MFVCEVDLRPAPAFTCRLQRRGRVRSPAKSNSNTLAASRSSLTSAARNDSVVVMLLFGWKISARMPAPNHSGSLHGPTMSDLRERPALRKCDQPRQQYAASPLESQSASRPRTGERGAQADTRLHCLPAIGSREEGRLIRRNIPSGKVVTW